MEVKAPGVIKLLGEHAVVYGYTCIAAAVSLYSTSKVEDSPYKSLLTIRLADFGNTKLELSMDQLTNIYTSYKGRKGIAEYINQNSGMSSEFLPYATIASRMSEELGINVLGKEAVISSEIKPQTGLASSASCYTAFATSLLDGNSKMSADQIIDVARDGERINHRNESAGRIDVGTSFYGGLVCYDSKKGSSRESFGTELEMLVVNTGPKRSTAEMVAHVAELYKNNREGTEEILKQINQYSIEGLNALKSGKKEVLGDYMFKNHMLLKQLGVSNENLDKTVEISKRNKALGAKLSGGGGGGAAVVLIGKSTDTESLVGELKGSNFEIWKASISPTGAYHYLGKQSQQGA